MRRIVKIILGIMLISMFNFNNIEVKCTENNEECEVNTKRDILVCMLSYPEMVRGVERDRDGNVYLIMKDGRKVLYDDRVKKLQDDKFYNSDLEDTLSEIYPLNSIEQVMSNNRDPGRFRCYSFLNALYGENKGEIDKNIHTIVTACGNVTFNKANNASENLRLALNEVGELIKSNEELRSFVVPLSGGYNYRFIKDTQMLSPHGYGIAIDLNKNDADYWKWATKEQGSKRIKEYPTALVKIFEKYGFVWGGKWAHFDILHFEYRPEIILKAKYFSEEVLEDEEWYEGIPMDENTKAIIKEINRAFKL